MLTTDIPVTTNRRGKSKPTLYKTMASLLIQAKKEHGRVACLSSVVRTWALSQNESIAKTTRPVHIDLATNEMEASELSSDLLKLTGGMSREHAQVAFEILASTTDKHGKYSIYTPNYIIKFIIRHCIRNRLSPTIPMFLDPACGSGAFIIEAIQLISENYRTSREAAMNDFVWGVDICPESLQQAKINIEMFCLEAGIKLPRNNRFLIESDSLLLSQSDFNRVMPFNFQGFDIIATNPPYQNLHDMDEDYRELLKKRFPAFTSGAFSTALMFILKGHDLLAPSGQLGYITQNNLLSSLAGRPLREHIQRTKSLNSIVNFGQAQVFKNAQTYTCLLFLSKTPQDSLRYVYCKNPAEQLSSLRDSEFNNIKIDSLDSRQWHLAPQKHLDNLKKINECGTSLKELANIRVGFATLKDSVFLIDEEVVAEHRIEQEILRPAAKVSELSTHGNVASEYKWVIQPYRKHENDWHLLDEQEFADTYPNAYSYLLQHKSSLEERDPKQTDIFYEWGRKQSMDANGPKLLNKTYSKHPSFLLDESDSLFCNGYSITPDSRKGLFHESIDIKVLQKILNSSIMDYYIRLTSFQISGGYYCYQKNFIENFCIPRVTEKIAETILRLQGTALNEYLCEFFNLNVQTVAEVTQNDFAHR